MMTFNKQKQQERQDLEHLLELSIFKKLVSDDKAESEYLELKVKEYASRYHTLFGDYYKRSWKEYRK